MVQLLCNQAIVLLSGFALRFTELLRAGKGYKRLTGTGSECVCVPRLGVSVVRQREAEGI